MLNFFCYLLFAIKYFIISVHGNPAEYCLYPFNRSDCGGPPTPVFTYWKPGSRCEVSVWKGCPSYNRFDNEVTCSHLCIGKLRFEYEGINEIQESCEGEINTDDCGAKPTSVYTYKKHLKTCLKVEWKGCKTSNKFSDEIQCLKACTFTEKDIGDMNNILDKFLEITTVSDASTTVEADTTLDTTALSALDDSAEDQTLPEPVETTSEDPPKENREESIEQLNEEPRAEIEDVLKM